MRLRTKIKSILTYEGIKTPTEHGLFTQKGVEWLHSLTLEPVESYLTIINPLDNEIKKISKHLKELAEDDEDVRLLMTIPGVGYYTALLVKSEIGDIKRFPSPEKLVSWAGLAPKTHQSGETSYNGHITKKGSSRVRWILGQAAQTARLYDPKFKTFYQRIAAKKGHNKALVATMRKMLVIIWTILTKNEPYSGEDQELTERKYKRLIRISS